MGAGYHSSRRDVKQLRTNRETRFAPEWKWGGRISHPLQAAFRIPPQACDETSGQIRTDPVTISKGLAPPKSGRKSPAASAASSASSLVMGVNEGLKAYAGLYTATAIFHGP